MVMSLETPVHALLNMRITVVGQKLATYANVLTLCEGLEMGAANFCLTSVAPLAAFSTSILAEAHVWA